MFTGVQAASGSLKLTYDFATNPNTVTANTMGDGVLRATRVTPSPATQFQPQAQSTPEPAPAAAPAPVAAPAAADTSSASTPTTTDTSSKAQTLANIFNTTENNAPGEKAPQPINVSTVNYAVSGQYAVANIYSGETGYETAFYTNGPNWTLLTYCGTNIRSTYGINGIPASTLSQLLAQTPVPSSAD